MPPPATAQPQSAVPPYGEAPPPEALLRETWNDVFTRRIFGQERPPRWVLVLSFSRLLLIERGKWTHHRLLRFDFDEILGRREDATLKATAALLHRECLLPPEGGGGRSLLNHLDDNSHKHAFAVSEDLKYALRESIELIGDEAIRYLREVRKDRLYDRPDDALAGRLGLEGHRRRLEHGRTCPLGHRGRSGCARQLREAVRRARNPAPQDAAAGPACQNAARGAPEVRRTPEASRRPERRVLRDRSLERDDLTA